MGLNTIEPPRGHSHENVRFSLFLKFEILNFVVWTKNFRIYVPVKMAINSKFTCPHNKGLYSPEKLCIEYKSLLNLQTNLLREMQMFCK